MKGTPTGAWGKLDRAPSQGAASGEVLAWHPLVAHCADVAACAEALLRQTILGRRIAHLAGQDEIDDVAIARFALIAALHDLGKANVGFQRKGDAIPGDVAGHVTEVLALLGAGTWELAVPFRQAVAFVEGWSDDGAAAALLFASICHHGKPLAVAGAPLRGDLWRASPSGGDPLGTFREIVHAAKLWFPDAFRTASRPLPTSPQVQHAFAGLVMLADWIGSDTSLFPYAEDHRDRMPFARERARTALRALGLDASVARAALGSSRPTFAAVSGHAPRDAQRVVTNLPLHEAGSLTVLESETGSGKTEAALARYLQLFHAGLVDGLTFALPTRTSATQIHRRIVEIVRRAFGGSADAPPVVLAVPGYLQVDDKHGRRLPGFEVLWNDDRVARDRHRGWAAENTKRYLAGAIVVGTVDQVLLSSLQVGHAHLRATALLRHLLVVDEVHASDIYMSRILEEVLRFHAAAGGHALLMSATLGTAVRTRFERASGSRRSRTPSPADALRAPYPAVHDGPAGTMPVTTPVLQPGLPKVLEVEVLALADEPAALAERALSAARAGARVLVLRNTVSAALATQAALEGAALPTDRGLLFAAAGAATVHHARFARADRIALDDAVEGRLGPLARQDGGVVVVATQTVQQALDLDADLIFTDLAPMDVLLQRFGRVHRHRARDPHRPTGFETPRAFVLTGERSLADSILESGEARGTHGVGTVYVDVRTLQATLDRLSPRATLRIPDQNRELVEVTTHPEILEELTRRLGGAWERHGRWVRGAGLGQSALADVALVARTAHIGTVEAAFPTDELHRRISTRLGEGNRRIVVPGCPVGPFGNEVSELSLPDWQARGIPSDADETADAVRTDGDRGARVVHLSWAGLSLIYDRLGLRPAPIVAALVGGRE